jgi:hypothetical protein
LRPGALELLERDVDIDHPLTDGLLVEFLFLPESLLALGPQQVELLVGQTLAERVGIEMPVGQRELGDLAG